MASIKSVSHNFWLRDSTCTKLNDDPQVRLTSYGFKSRELATSLVSVIKMVITQLPGSSSSLSSSSLSSPLPSSSSYDEYQIILIILIITCQRPQDDYSSQSLPHCHCHRQQQCVYHQHEFLSDNISGSGITVSTSDPWLLCLSWLWKSSSRAWWASH